MQFFNKFAIISYIVFKGYIMLFGKFLGFRSYGDASFYILDSNVLSITESIKDTLQIKECANKDSINKDSNDINLNTINIDISNQKNARF